MSYKINKINFEPDILEFLEIYNKYKSAKEVGKFYNINEVHIRKFAKLINFNINKFNGRFPSLNKEQQDYILNNYHTKTSTTIANELNCHKALVQKIWKENNKKGKRKLNYYSDFNYFENIDTPEKAYWLGFLYADGCVHKRKEKYEEGSLSIQLNIKDIELINTFKKDIKSENPITYNSTKRKSGYISNFTRITIISDKIFNDLIKLGCVPRKTFQLKNIPNIENNLIRHFIRGYFDGDGSIFKSKTRNNTYGFCINGQLELLNNIKQILENELNIELQIYKDKRTVNFGFITTKVNNKIKIIYNYLYNNASRFLKRKKDIFEEVINI